MLKNEDGMTLVEVLATLILLTLVTGIIWTTVSISLQFNLSETTELELQKEANYIISRLQQTHRYCASYDLKITGDKIEVLTCKNKEGEQPNTLAQYKGLVSEKFKFGEAGSTEYQGFEQLKENVDPEKKDLDLKFSIIGNKINENRPPRSLTVDTTISRYKTDGTNSSVEGEEE